MQHPPSAPPHRTPITLRIEYEDHSVLHGPDLHSRVAGDLEHLGLPRISEKDLELGSAGTLTVRLRCLDEHLEHIRELELSTGHAVSSKKSHCGIKRIWSLTRLRTLYSLTSRKRTYSQIDSEVKLVARSDNLRHRSMRSPSPSSHSEESDASPRRREASLTPETAPSDSPTIGPSESVDPAKRHPEVPLLRLKPLDQSDLSFTPYFSPVGLEDEESVITESRPTTDPRIRGGLVHRSSACSPIDESNSGYRIGTRIFLVQTDETHACGSDARLRRLLQREKMRGRELIQEVESEMDKLRERVRTLEHEQIQACAGLERCRILETQMDRVREECLHPFVVPALLDVFLKFGEFQE